MLLAVVAALASPGQARSVPVGAGEEPVAIGAPGDAPDGGAETAVSWESVGAKTMDAIVLRPLGAAATVGGLVFFVISAPMLVGSWGVGAGWDTFVMAPAEYTFQRPLGDF